MLCLEAVKDMKWILLLKSIHPGIVNHGHVKALKSHLALLKSLKQCYSKDGSKLMPICKSFIFGSDAADSVDLFPSEVAHLVQEEFSRENRALAKQRAAAVLLS